MAASCFVRDQRQLSLISVTRYCMSNLKVVSYSRNLLRIKRLTSEVGTSSSRFSNEWMAPWCEAEAEAEGTGPEINPL